MAPLAKVFGGIATVLVTLMLIGFVLPGTWSAEASIQIEAAPTEVFPLLNDLSRWDTWTNWGDIESELSDPPRSAGASRSWDDPNFGAGSVTITSSVAPTLGALRGGGRRWRFGWRGTQDRGSRGREPGDLAGSGRPRAQSPDGVRGPQHAQVPGSAARRGTGEAALYLLTGYRHKPFVRTGSLHHPQQFAHRVRGRHVRQLPPHGP